MNRTKTILGLYIVLALLVMMAAYASISDIDFSITGNAVSSPDQSNFKVKFTGTPTFTGTGTADTRITSDTTATINVSDIISVGETMTVQLIVSNQSYDLTAYLTSLLTNTNETYFEVTQKLSKNEIVPGGSSTLTITIKLIKAPVSTAQTATIGVKIIASPTQKSLISFTIDGTKYSAEAGMTWAQWCSSAYNVNKNYRLESNQNIWDNKTSSYIYYANGIPKSTDTIISGQAYYSGY